ncbi:MAG: filamentous hemagglutinin [Heteroscytonema crispum UTEX LB 1556]
MLKKSFAFSLFAAGLMIAPGAAFADVQNSQQSVGQTGTALGTANTVVNNATQNSRQNIDKFKAGGACSSGGLNVQNSGQSIGQGGAGVGGVNTVVNQAQQGNFQNTTDIAGGYGYGWCP